MSRPPTTGPSEPGDQPHRAPERPPAPFRTRTSDMGPALVPIDKALHLAGELEDAELIRRARRAGGS